MIDADSHQRVDVLPDRKSDTLAASIAISSALAAPPNPAFPSSDCSPRSRPFGYTGGLNLLYKYINQGRLNGDRITPSPRRLTRWLLTRPENLSDDNAHTSKISCPPVRR